MKLIYSKKDKIEISNNVFLFQCSILKSSLIELFPLKKILISKFYNSIILIFVLLYKHNIPIVIPKIKRKTDVFKQSIFDNMIDFYSSFIQQVFYVVWKKYNVSPLLPFWNNDCFTISKHLDSKNNNIRLNVDMTYLDNVNDIVCCKKIRLYPTSSQSKIFQNWIHTRRFVYNKVLSVVKNQGEKVNFISLRNKYVLNTIKDKTTNKRIQNPNVKSFEINTPKDIRANAVFDLESNFKSNFEKLKKGIIQKFQMRYISKKKQLHPSISIPKSAITLKRNGKIQIYSSYIKDKIKRTKQDVIRHISYDCRLQYTNGKWFLCVPYKQKQIEINQTNNYCALDPGVRTFQTIFSPYETKKCKENKELKRKLLLKLDLLRSLKETKQIKSSHYKQRFQVISFQIQNQINELHYQTINYLTSNYKQISLPKFESQELGQKIQSKKVNRSLFGLKHYLFQQRLLHKGMIKRCYIDICTEEYTTQTCGWCGILNKSIGTKETFQCDNCGVKKDRDENGARNISIKRLKETGYLKISTLGVAQG